MSFIFCRSNRTDDATPASRVCVADVVVAAAVLDRPVFRQVQGVRCTRAQSARRPLLPKYMFTFFWASQIHFWGGIQLMPILRLMGVHIKKRIRAKNM